MRDPHRLSKLLFKSRFHREVEILDLPGDEIGLFSLIHIEKSDTGSVTGCIPYRIDVLKFTVREKAQYGSRHLINITAEGTCQDNLIYLLHTQGTHHGFRPSIHGALGQLNCPDVILTDYNILTDGRLFCPSDDKLGFAVHLTITRDLQILFEPSCFINDTR